MALRRASANTAESRRKKRKTEEIDLPETALEDHSKTLELRKARSSGSMEENGRMAALQSQLPLQRGRKVAFCQPPRDGQSGSEEEWILATVMGTIHGDKYRYVVQDAEDESTGGPYVYEAHTKHMEYDYRLDHPIAQQRRYPSVRRICNRDACAGPVSRHKLLLLGDGAGGWPQHPSAHAAEQGGPILLTLVAKTRCRYAASSLQAHVLR